MDVRTGFVTQIGMDAAEAVRFASDEGFDFVELLLDGETAPDRLADGGTPIREALAAEGLDLLVHLPFGGIDLGSPFDPIREGSVEAVAEHAAVAADLGAEKAVLHPDSDAWSPAWDDGEIRERVADSLRTVDARAADRGVEICVENLPRSRARTHDFPDLFDRTDVSMTLDTGHARVDGRDAPGIASFVADHADRISHVHLNDTRGASDEHLPFGAGTLDFERVFDAFPDDWRGTMSLEVFTLDFEYLAASGERLERLLRARE